ncbi:hypothetical protein [Ancylobacter sp. SL191]|uniref:hypothetical protein n=1 Tax=Ancylobacter sp. SL191 TaxID=2995166 RepID=UPI00227139FC|nr:hypothetical protein [Ancylobacter sp. SL191]WAC26420.1 hypothetical protein OU996_15545 [Ancylobacter sp. SL191]
MSWDDALARADEACAAYFDTVAFTVVPMRKPGRDVNGALEPDPTRPGFSFHGSLDTAPELNAFAGSRSGGADERSRRQVSRVCLTALMTGWPWTPKQDDRLRTESALYQLVAAPETDGSGRAVLWLNRISA